METTVLGDCFISFKGKRQGAINGEAQDEAFKGTIDVESWHWGVEVPVSQGFTDQIGRIRVRPFIFSHRVDAASAQLLSALATHEEAEAELTMRRAGGQAQKYLKISFKDVRLLSIEVGYTTPGQIPLESVTFTFARMDYEYAPQTAVGGRGGSKTWTYIMPEH
jgi:type VI secretion system secreted protein Hcp